MVAFEYLQELNDDCDEGTVCFLFAALNFFFIHVRPEVDMGPHSETQPITYFQNLTQVIATAPLRVTVSINQAKFQSVQSK